MIETARSIATARRAIPALVATLGAMLALARPAAAAEQTTPSKGQHLGSCTVAGVSCVDFEKGVGAAAREACLKYKLAWSDAACPTEKVVGTCVKREGAGRSFTHSYPPGTVDTARKACAGTAGGVFIP
jgi:hypothetical protein